MQFINLKQFRKERGLTQKQLGDALQLPQSTISYLENGLQEATDYLIDCIKRVYNVDNLDGYVYERKTFHDPEKLFMKKSKALNAIFEMNWDMANPIDILEGFPIICKIGQISIAKDGTLLIDRNIGIGYRLSYYIIRPEKFGRADLILSITTKDWFDFDVFEDFKRAYFIGCCISGIHPVEQSKEIATT